MNAKFQETKNISKRKCFSASGYVADQNSYDVTYFVIGGGTAFGASLLFTMPLVERFYEYLKPKDHEKKLNTLVTASNGDLPSPTTVNQSENGTV